MKSLCLFVPFLFLSFSLFANTEQNISELEGILNDELAQTTSFTKSLPSPETDGTHDVSKGHSLQEMMANLKYCQKQKEIETHKVEGHGFKSIAISCLNEDQEIRTSEYYISTNDGQNKVLSYQEMNFTTREVPDLVMRNMMLNYDMESIRRTDNPSPAIQTLFSLIKVAAPIGLSFKTAKVLSPNRLDWQKHFVTGAIISGVTVLTSQALIRFISNRRGYGLSNTKITLLSSLAGLMTSIIAGVAKETYDRYTPGHTSEFRDVLYTAAGGAMVSLTFTIPLDRLFRIRRKMMPSPIFN